MNKVLEKVLQKGFDDFEFITEKGLPAFNVRARLLKHYIDSDLSVLDGIINESEDKRLVEQCKKYLEAAALRNDTPNDTKKKEKPNWRYRTTTLDPLRELVYLYILQPPCVDILEFKAFCNTEDTFGHTNFHHCNHQTERGTCAVIRKDDFLVCEICGKTVLIEDIRKEITRDGRENETGR